MVRLVTTIILAMKNRGNFKFAWRGFSVNEEANTIDSVRCAALQLPNQYLALPCSTTLKLH